MFIFGEFKFFYILLLFFILFINNFYFKKEQKKNYILLLELQNFIINNLKPGKTLKQVYEASFKFIKEKDKDLSGKIGNNFGFGVFFLIFLLFNLIIILLFKRLDLNLKNLF